MSRPTSAPAASGYFGLNSRTFASSRSPKYGVAVRARPSGVLAAAAKSRRRSASARGTNVHPHSCA